jgi:hypothetical protein
MDPVDPGASGDRFEIFDANQWFVVIRDDEGYAVWRLEELGESEPIERFTDDDDGYESAAARWKELTKAERRQGGRWLGPFRVVILVSLATWVAASAVALAISIFGEDNFFPGDPSADGLLQAIFLLSSLSFDVWIAATIAYVILWLELRRAR